MDEDEDPSYGNDKRTHSAGTKKRLAENNAQHYDLQKQRGKKLKEMIPEAFLDKAQNVQGSNRELIRTLNATMLYIVSLLEDKEQLQEQLAKCQKQSTDDDIGCGKEDETAPEGRLLRSQKIWLHSTDMENGYQAIVGATGMAGFPELDKEHSRAIGEWPEVNDADGTLPLTPVPDISPHDSLLRQAVEKFIALIKESAMGSQGVIDKSQIARLSTVHDCIVGMVEEMRNG